MKPISIDVDKKADIGDETESHKSIKVELASELLTRPKTNNDVGVTTVSSSKIQVEDVSSVETVELKALQVQKKGKTKILIL